MLPFHGRGIASYVQDADGEHRGSRWALAGEGKRCRAGEDRAPVFVARTTLAWVRAAAIAASSRSFSSFLSTLISLRKWLRSPLS